MDLTNFLPCLICHNLSFSEINTGAISKFKDTDVKEIFKFPIKHVVCRV